MPAAARSDRGRAREENEDRFVVRTARGSTLLAVADGVGGEAGGDVAARAAVDGLADAFAFGSDDIASALATAVRAANDAVLRATREHGLPTAASTLVAAAVRGDRCAIANLGDSRAYLVRSGSARQITADHSGAYAHSITRFVGDDRGVAADVFTEDLRPRDRLVLCSDGLSRYARPDDIARAARETPARAAQTMVDLANERGGEDNVTVIVYEARAPIALALTFAVAAIALAMAAVLATTLVPTPAAPSASPSPTPSASPTETPSPTPSATP